MAWICGRKHALQNRGVDDLVKKQSLKESVCKLRMCHEQGSRLVWMRNHESFELGQDLYQLSRIHCGKRLANHVQGRCSGRNGDALRKVTEEGGFVFRAF